MADKMLDEDSPIKVTHSAPSPGAVEVDSEDKSSTTTGAGDSKTDDLNASKLLGDDEAEGDGTEETLTSIPIDQVLIHMRDRSFEIAAYAKSTLNTSFALSENALRLSPDSLPSSTLKREAKKVSASTKPRRIKATLKKLQYRLKNRHKHWSRLLPELITGS